MLLERERELERVDAELRSAGAGSGIAVVIEGEPGIGKTSLLAAARERAAAAESPRSAPVALSWSPGSRSGFSGNASSRS